MNAKYEPCSICERHMNGFVCDEGNCPVAVMKAENERLSISLEVTRDNLGDTRDQLNKAETEIERLKDDNQYLQDRRWKELSEVRAEAIKEFAERLKENISNMEYTADVKRKTVPTETLFVQVNWVFHEIVPETIDKLAKEMTGDTK